MSIDQRVKDIVKELGKHGVLARPDTSNHFFFLYESPGFLLSLLGLYRVDNLKPIGALFLQDQQRSNSGPHWAISARDADTLEKIGSHLSELADKYQVTILGADARYKS
jgi:hypothetical protein